MAHANNPTPIYIWIRARKDKFGVMIEITRLADLDQGVRRGVFEEGI